MPQSLAQMYLHVVFSTKNREPFLADPGLREQTHVYLVGMCRNFGSPAAAVGGVVDHVHVLCRLAKTLCVADPVRERKRESSKWVKDQSAALAGFYWQNGYGAFSVGPEHVERLVTYIAGPEEHHRTESFQDEYRRLLALYQIEYDERYVWD